MSDEAGIFPSLAVLAATYRLGDGQIAQLSRYGTALATDPLAPTTVRDPLKVRDDHLADALAGLEVKWVREAASLVDLGSGAGVPGIPLAIARPEMHATLVEGNGRKCDFMRAVADELRLSNVTVVHARAETWSDGLATTDVVTARALAPLDVVAEYAAPLLRVGGALVAWRGQRDPEDEAAGRRAAEILGLAVQPVQRVEPYRGALHRHMHVMVKEAATPDRFPRRDGVARKRPLGRT
jgi:16S rRNA (guanine527-N7)-methyltransferase